MSKYFFRPRRTTFLRTAPSPTVKLEKDLDSVSVQPFPEKTQQILHALDLPDDFFLSDSSLSDVPSDFEENCPSDWSRPTTPQRLTVPRTPSKSAVSQTSKARRITLPKTSPYFAKAPAEPNSCLPFPSIAAPSFGLIQEQLAHDPFRLIIATFFLNKTRGVVALPVLFQVFQQYPTIEAMASADVSELMAMIHSLGLQNRRAEACIKLAQAWLLDPPTKGRRHRKLHYPRQEDGRDILPKGIIDDDDPRVAWEIAHLPGVGTYALDSWRIFCRDQLRGLATDWKGSGAGSDFIPEWKSVMPQDKELRAYLTWMWLKEGWVWDRHTGKRKRASDKMMRAAQRGGIAEEQDGNWVLETSPVKATNEFHSM